MKLFCIFQKDGEWMPCYHLFSQAARTACLWKCRAQFRDSCLLLAALLQNNGCKTVTAYWCIFRPQKDGDSRLGRFPCFCTGEYACSVCSSRMYSQKALPAPLIFRLLSVGGSFLLLLPISEPAVNVGLWLPYQSIYEIRYGPAAL